MREEFEELIDYAKSVIDDEGCFSIDQIVSLKNMIHVLADAMRKEFYTRPKSIYVSRHDDP